MAYFYKEPKSKTIRKVTKSMIKILAFSKNSPVISVMQALKSKGTYVFSDGSSIYFKGGE